ncbi:MAG: peroxide stress protein YaaA [Rickettsiales bacterium]
MLILLSPAKTLDEMPLNLSIKSTDPYFQKEIRELVAVMRKKSSDDLQKLMGVSKKIAELNYQRYQDFSEKYTNQNSKPSLFMFKGEVYNEMQVADYKESDLNFAQKHLYIISGLYGLLRPLDKMQPYRLEMSTRLKTKFGKNLYDFWGNRIVTTLNKSEESDVLINLASKEYFSSVNTAMFNGRIVNIHFKVNKGGALKVVGIIAKRARGSMADYIIKNKIRNLELIKNFKGQGFRFDEKLSNLENFVFVKST